MKRTMMTACLILYLLFFPQHFAQAEDTFDYRTDTELFCSKVAELNIELEEQNREAGHRGEKKTLVLFQAKEIPLRFEDERIQPISVVYGPDGFSVLLSNADPQSTVRWLQSQENVLYAEIDSVVSGCSSESDSSTPTFHSWGAEAAGFGAYESFAKRYGTGACAVAVIDSGTFPHSLITPKLITGGYDYIDNDSDSTNDLNGHGTRVSGIVADCTQELPVYIYPIRVLDADANGRTSNVISAVLEATDTQVDIINLSLSTFSQSELLESAIRRAISSGIVVVAAAGNYACDAAEVTPGCMTDPGILVVGSAEVDGSRSYFSNYGSSVDLYFYGRDISSCSRSGGYVADSGTSMSAPHISALCAMVKLTHPSISPDAIASRLQASSDVGLCIPCASAMVPQSLGFQLRSVLLRVGDRLQLPVSALPASAQEAIRFETSDNGVVELAECGLYAKSSGQAEITVKCTGFGDSVFSVTVCDGNGSVLKLPSGLLQIGDEAFYGLSIDRIVIPPGTQAIGNQAFDGGTIWFVTVPKTVYDIRENSFSGAVILCKEDSNAYSFATEHGLQYLLQNDMEE